MTIPSHFSKILYLRLDRPQALMSQTVYVSNIAFNATPQDLGKALETIGKIKRASILTEFFRGERRSRGIGFVEFEKEDEAKAAVEQSGKITINGRSIRIQIARPKQPRVTAFIAGIPAGTTKEMILEAFKANNAVDAKIVYENKEGEKPRRGFGFVKFATEKDTEECVKGHKEISLNGGVTIVRFAKRSFDAKPRRRYRRYRKAPAAEPKQ